jgi:uncharacterized protein (TIGR00369 family)
VSTEPDAIPEAFEPVPTGLGFSDQLQPYYRRRDGDEVVYGFRVEPSHANLMGICHGGVLMTLADIAAATNVTTRGDRPPGTPTINLGFDFLSPGRLGRWLWTECDHLEVKRRFGFCAGVIRDRERIVTRFNGTFYLPDHEGMKASDGIAAKLQGND